MVYAQIIGSIAFSISGATIGIKHKCDLFGIIVLGLTVTVGGGMIRDVIIGNNPPKIFFDLIYVYTSIITSILTYLMFKITKVKNNFYSLNFQYIFNIIDAIGLGIFTAVASYIVISNSSSNFALVISMAVITSCGGGVLRDIFVQRIPVIFKEDVYAILSLGGSVFFYILITFNTNINLAIIMTTFLVTLLRVIVFHIKYKKLLKAKKYFIL